MAPGTGRWCSQVAGDGLQRADSARRLTDFTHEKGRCTNGHHPVADPESSDPVADGDDAAGCLRPNDVWNPRRRSRLPVDRIAALIIEECRDKSSPEI